MARRKRKNPVLLNFRRLMKFGVVLVVIGGGIFGVHYVSPPPVKEKIEAATLDVIDLVREYRRTPRELVFWLDLAADHIPLMRGNVVPPGVSLDAGSHALGGAPAASVALTQLTNRGYMAGYNETMKNPAWVAYKVFPPKFDSGPRPSGFSPDPRTRSRIESSAYLNSGYDRGHMAPNHAIAVCYGPEAQRETFLMSNVVPQLPGLNSAFWEAMERRVLERYTRRYGDVWIICGPVYERGKNQKRLRAGVIVPDAFFLIVAEQSGRGIRCAAFLVPQQDIKKSADPAQFLVSVRDIEQATGLNFFPQLPADVQDALEITAAKRAW
ncbi:MAG: DNA/RNA non-specific endonuclease [Kiritimatiellales bacterium]